MGLLLHNSMLIAVQDGKAELRVQDGKAELRATALEIRDKIREQGQQQVQRQRERADQAQTAQPPAPPAPETPRSIIIHPPDRQVFVGGSQIPWDPNAGIPPQAVDMAIAFFLTVAVIIIGLPISRAFARRMDRKAAPSQVPPEVSSQLQQLAQSVDAIALEVERISEGQRFTTRLLTEQRDSARHALPAGPDR
jgi:hypothetical protein